MRKPSLMMVGITLFAALPCVANAQAEIYSGSVDQYALLNGENLSLYVDAYGDLGSPRQSGSPAKPGGVLNGSQQPYINTNGSVNSGSGGEYAALYDPNTTASLSLQASVQAKNEYISLGNAATLEGFGIHTGGGTTFVPYGSLTNNSFTVSGSSMTGMLSATSNDTYASGSVNLGVSQTVSFNEPGAKNIAQFTITFTNNGSSAISGLQYVRAVNPNQDMGPSGGGTSQTSQSFGTTGDPTAFSINSTGPVSNRQLAIGVHPTDPNAPGTTIYAVSGAAGESSLLTNPSYLSTYNSANYMQLNSTANSNGTYGATFVDRNLTGLTWTTSDYQGYLQNPLADPFSNGANTITPYFSVFSDTSLVLMSPVLPTLASGQSTSFSFYYIFPQSTSDASTPEPGMLSMIGAFSLSGMALRKRRMTR